MGRTHDVTISAFDLDRLEGELEGTKEELADAKATADFWMKKATEADKAADDLKSALRDAKRHWKEETEEQARLLGMSAERECDLRGKIKRLERELEAERALAEMYRRKCSRLALEHEAIQEQLDAAIMLGKMQERRHAREWQQACEKSRLALAAEKLLQP